mmetsp:Transcript_17476/g.34116  ORF Transcript_17476/g.34116 Transcript_17476/m.34116 type:complete len:167 (-) Transcript_17476:256-756(-)
MVVSADGSFNYPEAHLQYGLLRIGTSHHSVRGKLTVKIFEVVGLDVDIARRKGLFAGASARGGAVSVFCRVSLQPDPDGVTERPSESVDFYPVEEQKKGVFDVSHVYNVQYGSLSEKNIVVEFFTEDDDILLAEAVVMGSQVVSTDRPPAVTNASASWVPLITRQQ